MRLSVVRPIETRKFIAVSRQYLHNEEEAIGEQQEEGWGVSFELPTAVWRQPTSYTTVYRRLRVHHA